ncbi:TetR family transcriptional regulator [Cellulosimicrobium arenosum]|uniref:TetR family transcriptional regulator n=1 Tax=Cellulosimicrobium arenosum TaxID=2708133 RepID=A0A927PFC2_9MICO|nr:TetR family transcriptional regulator [Cellulosimicrobium arenosum]MBD8079715.1 TetR family transcriptional regulator [Cellulosimicrobium arenosum]
MVAPSSPSSRSLRTRAALVAAALDLFERQGYDATSAAQVAGAAGVTEMTFFRHFPTKEQVLLDDPYDPVLVAAVGARPRTDPPLARTVDGLRAAWQDIPDDAVAVVRRRTRLVARTPSLRGAVWRNNARTEDAVVDRLVADGTDPLVARAAVGATLAALTAALLHWADADDLAGGSDLADTVRRALSVLVPRLDRTGPTTCGGRGA